MNKECKFGDILQDEYAPEHDPHKRVMFIKRTLKNICCLAGDGSTVIFPLGNCRLDVVGHIDLDAALSDTERGT